MNFSIFYSWQSDIDERINRYFIRDAIKIAIQDLRRDDTIDESPRLDHDTKGVPGTPDIFQTIRDKIESAGIFLADVSYITSNENKDGIPNPNVMIELGYAFAKLGTRRIVTVLNDAFGNTNKLPFDLAHHRWPICYTLQNGTIPTKVNEKNLANAIAQAIRDIIMSGPLTNVDLQTRARIRSILDDPSNEVVQIGLDRSERILLNNSAALGIYDTLKHFPNPEIVCGNSAEQKTITNLLERYRSFRQSTTALDGYTFRFVKNHVKSNTISQYWKIISGYCIRLSDGWDEKEALLASQIQNIKHDGADCKRVYTIINSDSTFLELIKKAKEDRVGVNSTIKEFQEWQF